MEYLSLRPSSSCVEVKRTATPRRYPYPVRLPEGPARHDEMDPWTHGLSPKTRRTAPSSGFHVLFLILFIFSGDKGPKKPTRTNRRKERDLHKVTFLPESRSSRPASNTDNDSSRIIYLRDGRKEWSLEVRPETGTRTTDPTKTDPTTMTYSKEPTT